MFPEAKVTGLSYLPLNLKISQNCVLLENFFFMHITCPFKMLIPPGKISCENMPLLMIHILTKKGYGYVS